MLANCRSSTPLSTQCALLIFSCAAEIQMGFKIKHPHGRIWTVVICSLLSVWFVGQLSRVTLNLYNLDTCKPKQLCLVDTSPLDFFCARRAGGWVNPPCATYSGNWSEFVYQIVLGYVFYSLGLLINIVVIASTLDRDG